MDPAEHACPPSFVLSFQSGDAWREGTIADGRWQFLQDQQRLCCFDRCMVSATYWIVAQTGPIDYACHHILVSSSEPPPPPPLKLMPSFMCA